MVHSPVLFCRALHLHLVSALVFLLKIVKTIICRELIRIETNQIFFKKIKFCNKIYQLCLFLFG